MSDALISLFVAASAATFAYTKIGRRLGYSNQGSVWSTVAIIFVMTFIIVLVLLEYILKIHS